MQAWKMPKTDIRSRLLPISVSIFFLGGLYLIATVNYLLFHSLAEIFSIVVAFSVFVIAWNSRSYIQNAYLLFVGIAYLFIGGIDLLHTLAYKGMSIFTDYAYYANQLWIAARYMESITLLAAFWFLHKGRLNHPSATVAGYTIATGWVVAAIFYWKIFPVCFVEGVGLTAFKKISEYIICGILLMAIVVLISTRAKFDKRVFKLILWSIICTIVSELAFTFYVNNYGLSNLVGHYFKIFSFYLVYLALILTGIREPYRLTFYELEQANRQLTEEVAMRRESERQREKLIGQLRQALAEIDTLKGILPLCSFCKRVRDKNGTWHEVDQYIHNHSQADVSHSICPECFRVHYSDISSKDS